MSDELRQARDLWDRLNRRIDTAEEIGWTGFRGLTWDLLTKGQTPFQTLQKIRQLAADFERREKEYRDRQRKPTRI